MSTMSTDTQTQDTFTVAGREFSSRLLVGTGKYKDMDETRDAIEASGAEIVTIAVRRTNMGQNSDEPNILDVLPPERYTILPNTAGCYDAKTAVRTCRLARELLDGHNLVKLEVLGDEQTLFPDVVATLEAAEELIKDGFDVMVYTNDDPIMAKRLEELGCAAVMPLAAPIGSGLGIRNRLNIRTIVENAKVPILVDAGVGTASDAAVAMELGCDGVLMNTAIAAAREPVLMASAEGGTEIEVVAAETPDRILREEIDPAFGLLPFQARHIAYSLGFEGDAFKNGVRFLDALTKAAVELDTDLVEINPLVVTTDGKVMALDGKVAFDDSALFRHPAVAELRDVTEEDAAELEAKEFDLSFIKLDGDIGCMVNGAGLAMATMDIIQTVGGEPANFLDVGGGAEKEQIAAAFKIITKDPNVKGIFVNIFGGIMRCDVIAAGVIAAVEEVGLSVPLVVRLEGTNVDLGKQMLDESGLDLVSASDMKDGAQKILELTT